MSSCTTGAFTAPRPSFALNFRVHLAARVAPARLREMATETGTRFGFWRFQTAMNSKRRGAVLSAAGESGVTMYPFWRRQYSSAASFDASVACVAVVCVVVRALPWDEDPQPAETAARTKTRATPRERRFAYVNLRCAREDSNPRPTA